MDFVRLTLLYLHLIACCIAVALVFTTDVILLRSVLVTRSHISPSIKKSSKLSTSVLWLIFLLWITGVALVGFDQWQLNASVIQNPKLQAKIMVVIVLTINAIFLHKYVLPRLGNFESIFSLPSALRALVLVSSIVAAVSWLYAALLGIARPLNWKYSISEILIAYPIIIAFGFAMVASLGSWQRKHR